MNSKEKRCTFCYSVMALISKTVNIKNPAKSKSFFTLSVVKINDYIYRHRVCNRFLKVITFGLTDKIVNSGSQFTFASSQC